MTEKNAQRIANTITFLLVIAFGFLLAWWTWRMVAPHSRVTATNNEQTSAAAMIGDARTLFGDVTTVNTPAETTSNLRLKGVYAESADNGAPYASAVINLGGKDKMVKLGADVGDGGKLTEIHGTHIIVARAGKSERIELDKFRSTRVTAAAGRGSGAEGFRLNVASAGNNQYRLSRQELNTVLQDPRQIEHLGRITTAPNGTGIRVDDAPAQSLSGKLGLKTGDIITAINGQPVNSAGDLARIYQQFGTLATIRADVRRAGTPISLSYTISN